MWLLSSVILKSSNWKPPKSTWNLVQWKYFGQKGTKFSANIVKEITYINRIITVMWKRSIVILWCKAKFSLQKWFKMEFMINLHWTSLQWIKWSRRRFENGSEDLKMDQKIWYWIWRSENGSEDLKMVSALLETKCFF